MIQPAQENIPTISNEHVAIDTTPTFGRSLATISTTANTSPLNSTETLVSEMTSTPSVVNLCLHQATECRTLVTEVMDQSNQSEDYSL